MATYTMELYKAIEVSPDGNIGLNDYPIWDDAYRKTLNDKIIAHYHNQEIGMETVDMFRFAVKRRMNEVMPYYNDLYNSTKLEYDPLATIDLTTLSSGSSNSEVTAESASESATKNDSKSRAINSSFPQVGLSGRGDYATSGADTSSDSESSGNGSENSTSESKDMTDNESHVRGYQGIPSDLVLRYRDTILNIDLMVISELSDLFMSVWGNSDSYTPYPFTPLI